MIRLLLRTLGRVGICSLVILRNRKCIYYIIIYTLTHVLVKQYLQYILNSQHFTTYKWLCLFPLRDLPDAKSPPPQERHRFLYLKSWKQMFPPHHNHLLTKGKVNFLFIRGVYFRCIAKSCIDSFIENFTRKKLRIIKLIPVLLARALGKQNLR